jgi:hypothetical protein
MFERKAQFRGLVSGASFSTSHSALPWQNLGRYSVALAVVP